MSVVPFLLLAAASSFALAADSDTTFPPSQIPFVSLFSRFLPESNSLEGGYTTYSSSPDNSYLSFGSSANRMWEDIEERESGNEGGEELRSSRFYFKNPRGRCWKGSSYVVYSWDDLKYNISPEHFPCLMSAGHIPSTPFGKGEFQATTLTILHSNSISPFYNLISEIVNVNCTVIANCLAPSLSSSDPIPTSVMYCSIGGYSVHTIGNLPGSLASTEYDDGRPFLLIDFRQTGDEREVCGVNVKSGSWPNTAFLDASRVVGRDSEGCLIMLTAAYMEDTQAPYSSRSFLTQGYYSYKICSEEAKNEMMKNFTHGMTLTVEKEFDYQLGGVFELTLRMFDLDFFVQTGRYGRNAEVQRNVEAGY